MEKTMKLLEMRVTNFMNTHDETFKFFDKTMATPIGTIQDFII